MSMKVSVLMSRFNKVRYICHTIGLTHVVLAPMLLGLLVCAGCNSSEPGIVPTTTPTMPTIPAAGAINSVATILDDMTLPEDAAPQGVPSSWALSQGALIEAGNSPPTGMSAMTAWGQLYVPTTGDPANQYPGGTR